MQKVSLISWNIDAFSSRAISRAKLILRHILDKAPDIIFLQEVTAEVRSSLLTDARLRSSFLVTDTEDQKSFENVPFSTMAFLSSAQFYSGIDLKKEVDVTEGAERLVSGGLFRVELPSKYGRDALCVDIARSSAPSAVFRLINVHLDSLGDTLHYRATQMQLLADVLREPGCAGGLITGDFNAITPEDHRFVDENGLVDAWSMLHGKEGLEGATWECTVQIGG